MSYGVVFMCIIALYLMYYVSLIVYEGFFKKEGELVEDLKQDEEEINVSDENEKFAPTQILVTKRPRKPVQPKKDEVIEVPVNEDEEKEDGTDGEDDSSNSPPIQMNEGLNVKQLQQDVDNYATNNPEANEKLEELTFLYKNK